MNVTDILHVVLALVAAFLAIVFHEYAHGFVAYRLGDPTAREHGRLTLNPLAHIDPVGTVLLPLLLALFGLPVFGWAKPVPVNAGYFRNPFRGMLFVAISGPVTNLAFALLATAIGRLALSAVRITFLLQESFVASLSRAGFFLLGYFVIINVVLAVFNMIPIPPLDGSRVLSYLLPAGGRRFMLILEQYGFLILLALILLGGLTGILNWTSVIWARLLGNTWGTLLTIH